MAQERCYFCDEEATGWVTIKLHHDAPFSVVQVCAHHSEQINNELYGTAVEEEELARVTR
jgi:hypothetical protein